MAPVIADEEALRTAASQPINWLARWRRMVEDEHAQSDRVAPPRTGAGDWWAGQAGRFAAFAQRSAQPNAFMRVVTPHLRPGGSVLDIGAGTGRHTAYLARHAARVVAVEPSAGMRARLEQRLSAEGCANVEVVADAWPAAVPACDIAIAAHVIYAVREIGPFLLAMRDAARRACFVLVGVHQPSFFTAPFWQHVYGEARLPLPGAVECLGALAQLGVAAHAQLLPPAPYRFADSDEAGADLRQRLAVPPGSPRDAALREAMAELLVPDGEGGLVPSAPAQPNVVLWWQNARM